MSSKRKASSESKESKEKKSKPGEIEVKLIKRCEPGGKEAIWSVIDYLQRQVKRDKFAYSAWHNLDALTRCSHDSNAMFLCAFQDDKVVGFLCGPGRTTGRHEEVQMLEVFPGFRKKGVGTKLVRAAEKEIAGAHRHGEEAWSGKFAGDYACCGGSPLVHIPSILDDAKEFWTKLGYKPHPFSGGMYRMVGYQLPRTFKGRFGIPMYQHLATFTVEFKHYKIRKEAGFDMEGSKERPIEYHIYSSCFSPMIMLPHPRSGRDDCVGYTEHKELKEGEFFVSALGHEYPDEKELAAILVKEGVIECTKRTLMVANERVFVYRFSDKTLARFMKID